MCLEFPWQTRYICAFPQICSHFVNSLHELCPEEVVVIIEYDQCSASLFKSLLIIEAIHMH